MYSWILKTGKRTSLTFCEWRVFSCSAHEHIWTTLTTEIRSSESSASFISVCAEHHQQLIALRNKRGRLLPATPASQQGVCLAVTVEDGHRVVVALA